VRREVPQHAQLAPAERLGQRPRPLAGTGLAAGQQAEDLSYQGGVPGLPPGLALEQAGGGVQQEPHQRAVGADDVERTVEGLAGGAGVAEQVPGDRLQQERLGLVQLALPGQRRTPTGPG